MIARPEGTRNVILSCFHEYQLRYRMLLRIVGAVDKLEKVYKSRQSTLAGYMRVGNIATNVGVC